MTKNFLMIWAISSRRLMRYFLIYLFFLASLAANDKLIDLYQKEGLSAIEKIFDTQLTSQEYWNNKLHSIDTRFGYLEGTNYLLACDKNQTSLKLYTKDRNNSFILESDFSAFVGKVDGDKQREGDLKTPIGVYKLIQKLNKVDPFYGPLAFVTSYPNSFDKVRGKNGSGIWVHGLPLNQERDDYTKGCIAINNANIKHIEDQIDVEKALVYIDKKPFINVKKETLSILLSQLYTWRKAWKESDIETYLSFYDQNFKRNDGLDKKSFSEYKKRVFAKQEYKNIHFSKINILPYPMEGNENLYLISFHEEYSSSSYSFSGEKELYIHLDTQNFTILAEK